MNREDIKVFLSGRLFEQNSTKCLTSGANFSTSISSRRIDLSVDFPYDINLSEKEAVVLETLIHNAMELVLRPYFEESKLTTDYPLGE